MGRRTKLGCRVAFKTTTGGDCKQKLAREDFIESKAGKLSIGRGLRATCV